MRASAAATPPLYSSRPNRGCSVENPAALPMFSRLGPPEWAVHDRNVTNLASDGRQLVGFTSVATVTTDALM